MPTSKRPDPLADVGHLLDQITTGSGEPVDDLRSGAIPAALARRRGTERKNPIRPSEKRRHQRQVAVTFSSPDIPERLRALADRWGMTAPDPRKPSVSAIVEYLLLPQLEAAESGELPPPEEAE